MDPNTSTVQWFFKENKVDSIITDMYTHIGGHGAPQAPEAWGRLCKAQLPPHNLEIGMELPGLFPTWVKKNKFWVPSFKTAPELHAFLQAVEFMDLQAHLGIAEGAPGLMLLDL